MTLCRSNVISAYPITPQTHIVEDRASIVGEGRLDADYVNVESEFSAASVVLGASAAGARVYPRRENTSSTTIFARAAASAPKNALATISNCPWKSDFDPLPTPGWGKLVGRKSEAHPAFRINPNIDVV